MKTKNELVLIFSLFCFLSAMFAQNVEVSNGPVPTLKQERTKGKFESNADLVRAGYGYSATTQSILSASGPCGFDFLAFWSTSDYLSSMCQGGDGKYYVTGTSGPSLYQLDTVNISFVLLGNITGMGADVPNGISYNPVNGNYYIASSSNLFSFNVNSRVATLIGPFNAGGIMIDLCFDINGICYSYDIGTDNGYTINISTGNANLLGPLGYDANFGQGMSYDFDTQTIYLTAFNNSTFTCQCRIMDPVTGNTTLIYDWGMEQIDAFALKTLLGPPCPVGAPSNPNPPSGTTDVPLFGSSLSWINGSGTIDVEVWFGPQGNLTMVYNGAPITSFALPTLNYFTDYAWYVKCGNGTCFTFGPTWTFRTVQDPNLASLFCDDFSSGAGNWTITNDGGVCIWEIRDVSEYTLPLTAVGNCLALDTDDCNGTSGNGLSTARHNGIDATMYDVVWLEFDNDWFALDADDFAYVDVSVDGGTTWQNVFTWNDLDVRYTHEFWDLTSLVALSTFDIRFRSIQPGWDWWWAVDNICIYGGIYIPVELISFTAEVDNNVVALFWQTATETNNQGFEILRSAQNDNSIWERIGFVEGKGTTTEIQSYSFTDKPDPGKYKYRLKQIDFDGTSAYSQEIEAEVKALNMFSLEQNYPNPFNPTTKIKYTIPNVIANEEKQSQSVTLKVFDVLGNEVATLVDEYKPAGKYEVEFSAKGGYASGGNAYDLPSGVYFYQLQAGQFIETRKMLLLK